jgi:threonine/homoserine efflux transporter RhtA
MSNTTNKPPPWRGIMLSTNGDIIRVFNYNITPAELTDLFYAALENMPHAPIAMALALEKYNKNNSHD